MGLIEDLRKQKELSEQISRMRASETKEEREAKEEARFKEECNRAKKYYLSSALPKFIQALIEFDGWKGGLPRQRSLDGSGGVHVGLKKEIFRDVSITEQMYYRSFNSREVKRIDIDITVTSYGSARVKGDERDGSTTLFLDSSKHASSEIEVEEAVKKARLHPHINYFGPDTSSWTGSGGSTGGGGPWTHPT